MRKSAVEWQKTVLKRVNGVVDKCKEIENHLQEQEDIVENEKARIKAEAEAKEAARIQARRDRLAAMGVGFNGQMWAFKDINLPDAMVRACNDEQFGMFVAKIQEAKDVEDARIKAEEEARKVEAERVAKIAAEQAAERQRIEDAEKKLVIERLAIQAEQMKIEREKQRLIDEENKRLQEIADAQRREVEAKQRAEELEKARKEAAEKAIRDAEEKRLKDEADRIEKERLAKIAADKKAARQPDKIKLLYYSDAIMDISPTELKSEEAVSIFNEFHAALMKIDKILRDKAEAL
jgi:hypothetical protein